MLIVISSTRVIDSHLQFWAICSNNQGCRRAGYTSPPPGSREYSSAELISLCTRQVSLASNNQHAQRSTSAFRTCIASQQKYGSFNQGNSEK